MAAAAIEHEQVEDPTCWCCGSTFSEDDLVRLGSHPEVGVCTGCAQWLHRSARSSLDAGRRTPIAVMRHRLDAVRGRVIPGWSPGLAGRRAAATTPGPARPISTAHAMERPFGTRK